ncbi:DUF4158 domain-containing protein [Streptomyces litmocidini]|uniref:DUF4158 domain-containing protein n=1 Tax=Streptomyces litmocidini TaxID=67318 RepID=A0ABW7U630_9ACTN
MEFPSDGQAEAYGTFAEEPTGTELERFFLPDDVDRDLIALRRTEHHRLGFALQMCTVRYVRWTGTRTWCACWSRCTGP